MGERHLKQHKRSKHEGIRYFCDQCDYVATWKSLLNTHKESKHEGIRYPCKHCDYVATMQRNLKGHTLSKHGGQLCVKTSVKSKRKHVKVMIEKLDSSKYLSHPISQNSIEPEFIEISGMEIADTDIKIEDDIDPLSIKNFDVDG